MSSSAPLGRGPKVRAAVLAATVDELSERGYAAFTIDNVAQRTGVHKTTVYRRWPDRDSLIAEALAESVAAEIPIPDTGSVDEDLRALARSLVAWADSASGRAILAVLVSTAAGLPAPPNSARHVFRDRIRQTLPVVTRAIARGELPEGTDPAEMIKTLVSPIYFRVLITGERVDDGTADAAAKVALTAARAGLFT
ncbi:TetR family transcriptional regulator [Nocardia nova]|uniref:TetR family transcriptional regulator n=1 Tax=Nocardia nova TaxID=37330 RepID=A0A2S6AL25_9NOCA|nr:TetR/AcrR family transcriptional regulator [Nocardia nova]PPJ31701.1 TetR family transcriptional regulator [Nocardia nova]PPJ35941.1 TetR family transcriptional regulator [Nocardia nova]